MNKQVRWGILGTGRIAKAFAEGLKYALNGQLHAIGSRSKESAQNFADEFNIPTTCGSYDELTEHPSIDAIYIATPHTEHMNNALLCMENGKAVLCEKPFAVNAKQVEQMIQKSKAKNILLMEGMWSRFPPLMDKVRGILRKNEIGEIRTIHADFGFRPNNMDPHGRLFNPDLAGGSLLDVGIYPVSFSFMINGEPDSFVTEWTCGNTGVDEQASMIFKYSNGSMALLHSSIQSDTRQEAFISGTEGSIRIHQKCWKPQIMTQTDWKTGEVKKIECPFVGNGFNYEAEHFGQLFIEGKKESPIMPLKESMSIVTTLDRIRQKWQLRYPFE
jgi:dihydrodiol dehydrogenase / D-xylose 1-dehydrogenase (NADP)